MKKLFLVLMLLFLIGIGCEPPSNNTELPIAEFAIGERVLLTNDNPAIVKYKSIWNLDGKPVWRYEVNYFNLQLELNSNWFYEFELKKVPEKSNVISKLPPN